MSLNFSEASPRVHAWAVQELFRRVARQSTIDLMADNAARSKFWRDFQGPRQQTLKERLDDLVNRLHGRDKETIALAVAEIKMLEDRDD